MSFFKNKKQTQNLFSIRGMFKQPKYVICWLHLSSENTYHLALVKVFLKMLATFLFLSHLDDHFIKQ